MPSLHRIGKEKVINHHHEVPFRVLEKQYTYGDKSTENMIIHGDNLEWLKSLLPQYEGKIKCIYIDPPYNTGNEWRVYNDNMNHPKIKKRLWQTVGKEWEDFNRHDKWLCMMYPRLKLLHKLLRDDGVIFISIDDNEAIYLKSMLDEIFWYNNFVQQIIWKNKYWPWAMTKWFWNVHEYIFCYSKVPINSIEAHLSDEEIKKYKFKDEYFEIRWWYITQPLATKSKDDRPNLVYPIEYNWVEIRPNKQRIWSKERMFDALKKNQIVIKENNWKFSVRFKQYLKDEQWIMRMAKPISILNWPFNQDWTSEMEKIFQKKMFNWPKPSKLVEYLLSMITNWDKSDDFFVLDSFAGSWTTAHAVLNLNKQDGGDRKFILLELMDYAETITAERVKRVIDGYGEWTKKTERTGGWFSYYTVWEKLFDDEQNLNETIDIEIIKQYIRYTETKTSYKPQQQTYFLWTHKKTEYYFYYEPNKATVLDLAYLNALPPTKEYRMIYADVCHLSQAFLTKHKILFKKIPRDITKF
jgi:adenine-specific DNA-methyltransferase